MHHTDIEKLSSILIELYEKMSSWEHAVVKESGLTPAQMHAIEILGHQESLRMKELAQKLGVTTGTLTVMIDRLEQNGLISRKPNENDRRALRNKFSSSRKFPLADLPPPSIDLNQYPGSNKNLDSKPFFC